MTADLDAFWHTFNEHVAEAGLLGATVLFRGESIQGKALIPSIGRNTSIGVHGNIAPLEDSLMAEFKRMSTPIISSLPQNDFEWLFLAQHYGLPTRLLDWTTNPLVGLFLLLKETTNLMLPSML